MAEPVKIGFERSIAVLPISALLPLKTVPEAIKQSSQVQTDREVRQRGRHHRATGRGTVEGSERDDTCCSTATCATLCSIDIAATEVRCLIAADDEAYTYNKRINRLATVQEHFMIVRAIERGVSEDKLAKALNLDIKAIKRRRTSCSSASVRRSSSC